MEIQKIPPFVKTEKNTPANFSKVEPKSIDALDLASPPVSGPKNKIDTFHDYQAGIVFTSSPKNTYADKTSLTAISKIKNVLASAGKGIVSALACMYGAIKGLGLYIKKALISLFAKSPAQIEAAMNKALLAELPGSRHITENFFSESVTALDKDIALNKQFSKELPGNAAFTESTSKQ